MQVAPGGLVSIGISTEVPEFDRVKDGLPSVQITPTSPALVLWAQYFGNHAGDMLQLTLTDPEGIPLAQTFPLDRAQARAFRAFGKRLGNPAGWPRGAWQAEAILTRAGQPIDRQTLRFQIGD